MYNEQLYTVAEQDDLTISDVLTIFRLSLIFEKNNNLRGKHIGSSLIDLWHTIHNKKNCFEIYKDQIVRDKIIKR